MLTVVDATHFLWKCHRLLNRFVSQLKSLKFTVCAARVNLIPITMNCIFSVRIKP